MMRPCCPRCLHPGFDLVATDADGRPRFRCQHCAEKWTCGKSGGPYLAAAKKPQPDNRRERVLITGSRHWTDVAAIRDALLDHAGAIVIHGGCPTGADQIAGFLARVLSMDEVAFPADWQRHGRSAGPRRNQQMIDEGKPTVAYAFPLGDSIGTRDMIRRLRAKGIPVTVKEPPCE